MSEANGIQTPHLSDPESDALPLHQRPRLTPGELDCIGRLNCGRLKESCPPPIDQGKTVSEAREIRTPNLLISQLSGMGLWCSGSASDSGSERWGVRIPLASDMLSIQSCIGRRAADRTPVLQAPEALPTGALCLARLRAWGGGATATRRLGARISLAFELRASEGILPAAHRPRPDCI